jgi:hypothetical protein
MKTGKPKNRTDAEMQELQGAYTARFGGSHKGKKKTAPAIIKKLSSKVTALFGAKKE